MKHGICSRSGAERPRVSFTGRTGLNVDLEDTSNPMEHFKLFYTPDIAELIRE
jgi:hypothetical protein